MGDNLNKVKYILIGILVGMLVFGTCSAFAYGTIKLVINGREVQCDVPPQVIYGRTMVPAKFVAEALGATVKWDDANNAVVITGGNGGNTNNPTDIPGSNGSMPTDISSNNPVSLFSQLKPFTWDGDQQPITAQHFSITGEQVMGYDISSRGNIYFKLGGKYKTLTCYTGAVDGHTYGGQVTFSGNEQNKLLKQVGGIPPWEGLKKIEVDVTGIDVLQVFSYSLSSYTNPTIIVNATVQ